MAGRKSRPSIERVRKGGHAQHGHGSTVESQRKRFALAALGAATRHPAFLDGRD